MTAFSLIHSESGEPVNKITINQPTVFSLGVMVKVGNADGIVAFTDGDSANYEYRFYLSRNADTVQYQLGETEC